MSYLHFECAKEIRRVLSLNWQGLNRAALFEALQIQDKSDRIFGEVLAELCHGRKPQTSRKEGPDGVGIYTLMPDESGLVKATPPARAASFPLKPDGKRRCGCGMVLIYRGIGRAPEKCESCKEKARQKRYKEKRAAAAKCPTCGHSVKGAA